MSSDFGVLCEFDGRLCPEGVRPRSFATVSGTVLRYFKRHPGSEKGPSMQPCLAP